MPTQETKDSVRSGVEQAAEKTGEVTQQVRECFFLWSCFAANEL